MTETHTHVGGIIPVFTIGDRLRKAREFAGLEQSELANAIDVSRKTVGNYEASRVQPRVIVMKAWAMRTGVPLEWLRSGAAEAPQPEGPGGERARRDSNPQPSDP